MSSTEQQQDLLSFDEPQTTVQEEQESALVPHESPHQETVMPASALLHQKAFKLDYIGKRNKKSKQQITWTFVHGNETHTVMLTWSTNTGKVLVHLDGEQVDYSALKGYSIIHRKIEIEGFKFEILATRVVPNKADAHDFLAYECIINGKAFSKLPVMQENRLLMETPDGTGGQPLGIHSPSEEEEEEEDMNEDYATPYYVEDIGSVVDIVYPSGIPPYNP